MVVYYASTQDGGKIILNECSRKGQSNEWWRPIKIGNNYFIQNYGSHKVLVVPSGSTVWGTQIIQWAMDAGPGQTWNFIQK